MKFVYNGCSAKLRRLLEDIEERLIADNSAQMHADQYVNLRSLEEAFTRTKDRNIYKLALLELAEKTFKAMEKEHNGVSPHVTLQNKMSIYGKLHAMHGPIQYTAHGKKVVFAIESKYAELSTALALRNERKKKSNK